MLLTFFFVACLTCFLVVLLVQHLRKPAVDQVAASTIFETRIDPPFLRPVVTRLEDGDLLIEAPVVHARLVNEILVLDIKSNSAKNAEGFELAITGFKPEYLAAEKYHYFPSVEGHVLVGPQGDPTNRLLERTAKLHDLELPSEGGSYVQAYTIDGIVTDPGDFRVEVQATLPSGAPLLISYDYAKATVNARVPASALHTSENYRPLGVRLEAA